MDVVAKVKELASALDLKEKAQQDALAGRPATDAHSLTIVEAGLVGRARGEGEKELASLESQRESAQRALDTYKKEPKGQVPLDTTVQEKREAQLREAHEGAIAAFKKFKADHGLDGAPAPDDRVTQLMLAALVVIMEGLANSLFFAPASEYGFAGGFFAAFMFSFVNVAFAFLGGVIGLRYAGHTDPAKMVGGMLWTLACGLVCVMTVCLSAWYRGHLDRILTQKDWYDALSFEAWQASLESLAALNFWSMIASAQAFALLGVGVVCAFIGFWKGYSFDDPFPGFGKMFRKQEDAADLLAQFVDEKNSIQLRKPPAELAFEDLKIAVKGLRRALGTEDLGAQVTALTKQLLQIYRDANERIRATEPPAYFNQYPDQQEFRGLATEWERLHKACEGFEREHGRIEQQRKGAGTNAREQGA